MCIISFATKSAVCALAMAPFASPKATSILILNDIGISLRPCIMADIVCACSPHMVASSDWLIPSSEILCCIISIADSAINFLYYIIGKYK